MINLQDYSVVAVIGEGGFAKVQRLRHKKTGREIALKSLSNESIKVSKYRSWFAREVSGVLGKPYAIYC